MARGRSITTFGQMFPGLSHGSIPEPIIPEVPVPEPTPTPEPGGGGTTSVRRLRGIMKGPVPQDKYYKRDEKKWEDDEVFIQLDD